MGLFTLWEKLNSLLLSNQMTPPKEKEMKHTSGPWKVCKDGFIIQQLGSGGPTICDLAEYHDRESMYNNWEANANLIASAPEMYKELKRLLEKHGYLQTKEVLDKAEGKQ